MVKNNLKVFAALGLIVLMCTSNISLAGSFAPGVVVKRPEAQLPKVASKPQEMSVNKLLFKSCFALGTLAAAVGGAQKLFMYGMVPENVQELSAVQLVEVMNEKTATTFKLGGGLVIGGSFALAYNLMRDGFSEKKDDNAASKLFKKVFGIGIGIASMVGALKLLGYNVQKA